MMVSLSVSRSLSTSIIISLLSLVILNYPYRTPTTALIMDEGYILDTFSSQNDSYAWKVADINNDGLNDLIVVEDFRTLCIYFQNEKHELNSTPLRVALNFQYVHIVRIPYTGDLNGDGRTDIAILSSYPPFWHEKPTQRRTLCILYQQQNMTFSLYKYYVGEWETTAQFGDVNNDGEDDIIFFKENPYTIEVYLNRGGLFYDHPDETLTFNTTMFLDYVLDFDLDGWIDLMLFDTNIRTIYYLKNIDGVFKNENLYPVLKTRYPFGGVYYCKIDSDDYWDIVQLNDGYGPYYNSNETYLWFAKGPLLYNTQPDYILHPGWNPYHAVFTDFNQDARTDIAILNWGTYYHCGVEGHGYNLTIFYQHGDGHFNVHPDLSLPVEHYTSPVEIGDLNHDGLDDIIVVEHNITIYFQYWPEWKIPPNVTLPDDFSVEFPARVSIKVRYEENFGKVIKYQWVEDDGPQMLNVTEDSFYLNFTPSSPGVYRISVRVEDEYHFQSEWNEINVTVFPNKPPEVKEEYILLQMEEGGSCRINLTSAVWDPDEALSFRILKEVEGILISEEKPGVFSVLPERDLNGMYNITFLCEDPFSNTVFINVTLNITPIPDQPRILTVNGKRIVGGGYFNIREGETLWLNFSVDDPDLKWEGDTLTLQASWGRFRIDGLSAELSASQRDVGIHTVVFNVTDRFGLSDGVKITIEVINVNDPPILIVTGIKERINLSEPLTVHFNESYDPDGDLLMFSLRIDNGSRMAVGDHFTLRFASAGVHVLEIMAKDPYGGVSSAEYRITVVGVVEAGGADSGMNRVNRWATIAIPFIVSAVLVCLLYIFFLKRRNSYRDEE